MVNLCGNQGRLRDVSTTSNTADIKSALFGVVEMSRKRPWWEFSIFCHTSLLYISEGVPFHEKHVSKSIPIK